MGTAPPRDRPAQRRGARLALAVLLPAVLAGGSSAVLLGGSATPPTAAPPPAVHADRKGAAEVGATGHLPQDRAPGPDLLRDARDPRALATGAGPQIEMPDGPLDIPGPMLAAYRDGARQVSSVEPSCGLHWSLLASIGRIESGHARSGRIDTEGTTVTAILGPRLDGGQNVAAVADTDDGRLDGDPVWDRAVGPMQFLPSTWQRYGVDGNGDGEVSPHNVHDSVVTAGRYLCSGDVALDEEESLVRAVFRYNHSQSYVREVLLWAAAYREGVRPVPAEVAPEGDNRDVLAGHRLSYRELRLDPVPPAPRHSGARSDLAVPGRHPVTRTPGTSAPPPSQPPSSAPPPAASPSSSEPPSAPPSSTPPSSTPPSTPSSSQPPSSSSPSSTPPSQSPPSNSPPSGDPATSEPKSSTTAPSNEPTSGSDAARTSASPSTSGPSPSGTATGGSASTTPIEPCDRALLDNGEFVTQERRDQVGPVIEPGTTQPGREDQGETVHVESDPAAPEGSDLRPCRVPSDYAPPE